ncbi:hypothetical protein [Microvirga rosea]|uniref:hypothetical protein n=1 Tax=Microvirga rosea TaxID=2715425 RepID=UPI001D0BDB03|nr:hypothetical protein [Microvirga rosea]MCB8823223.1 hypothetical protein [Microvirga rosea]
MSSEFGSDHNLRVSLRECRMVLERLMHVAKLDLGQVASTRDSALYSAMLGLGGFASLRKNIQLLRASEQWQVTLDHDAQPMRLDCAGQHAWVIAPLLSDLLVDDVRCGGTGEISISGMVAPGEVRVVEPFLQAQGFTAEVSWDSVREVARVSVRPMPIGLSRDPLDPVRREGLVVPAATWWDLFRLSSEALAPDSFESRRHAGAIIVEADGRVIGRQDEDDTDLSLLARQLKGSVQDASLDQ